MHLVRHNCGGLWRHCCFTDSCSNRGCKAKDANGANNICLCCCSPYCC
ncbi:hypothetical protein RchiOBHm_Chr2g0117711 [Rosa chinensis]|uniref:Uncharacterized protein n=1 Tax=Rosa chinensis TaxID=74649 RepID=A0A2P6RRK9_ROSCH|nr:hypothetical protein RchiOBHm_Chr2g0117711 [Rosa chinensis]